MITYDGNTFLDSHIPHAALSWRNDERIFATCRQHTLLSIHDHQKWLQRIEEDKTTKMFGISTSRFVEGRNQQVNVGVCGLTNINWLARHAEFSLYIAPEYQYHGYAKSALYNLLKHGFYSFNLNKIWGEVFDTNERALKIFRDYFMMDCRKGHRQHYFKEGRYIDTWIVDITADEFNYHHKNGARMGNE